jgi:protein involved in polysaccharide export with SLBB domain
MKSFLGRSSDAVFRLVPVLLVLYGCTDVPKLPPAPEAPAASAPYLVQPGDTLDVKFLYNPELNDQPTVQPDGRISMLLAHDMKVGGLTTEQVRQAISDAYAHELMKPGVSVAIKGAVAWRIFVGGEVTAPNEFTGTGPTPTVTQAIALAGGLKDSGDGTKLVLLRRVNGKPVGYLAKFTKEAKGKKPAKDIQLASDDAIYVPKTGVADVFTAYNQYFKKFLPSNVHSGYSLFPAQASVAPGASAPAPAATVPGAP